VQLRKQFAQLHNVQLGLIALSKGLKNQASMVFPGSDAFTMPPSQAIVSPTI
jgi:hypothetical protein